MVEGSVPSGLRPSRGLSSITRLAESKNISGRKKRHRLYVIAVTGSDSVDFYVGQTTRLVENRLKQHQSRKKEKYAAKIFQRKRGRQTICGTTCLRACRISRRRRSLSRRRGSWRTSLRRS